MAPADDIAAAAQTVRTGSWHVGRWAHALVCLLSLGAVWWAFINHATANIISQYGPFFDDEQYAIIVASHRARIVSIAMPLVITLLCALIGWGVCVWRPVKRNVRSTEP